MISEETNKQHQKHEELSRAKLGKFGRNEIAILGTTCENIQKLAYNIIHHLTSQKVAYVDADHQNGKAVDVNNTIATNCFLRYTDKISFQRIDFKTDLNDFQKRVLFNDPDLILINGNHFLGQSQVVVIDPIKDLEKKREKLSDVKLILLKDKQTQIPDFIKNLPGFNNIQVLSLNDENAILLFFKNFLAEKVPPLNGLVLAGGQSSRMKKDKGSLNYHGSSQREYMYNLLSKHCDKTFISCNDKQAPELAGQFPLIQDTFLHLGPMGGILSAIQSNPNAAWLTVACDLPYLSDKTVEYLVRHRNPSKTATAFLDPAGEFPEPLITIWEPKSYLILLQFLSQGYSCPRKALINTDIELLKAPDEKEFANVNLPQQYEAALLKLKGNNTDKEVKTFN